MFIPLAMKPAKNTETQNVDINHNWEDFQQERHQSSKHWLTLQA